MNAPQEITPMPRTLRLRLTLLAMISLAATAPHTFAQLAQVPATAPAALSSPAPAERHRRGQYTLAQPGVPALLWLEARLNLNEPSDAQTTADIRSGKQKWSVQDARQPQETWDVCVPRSYAPGLPHGILVYINAGDSGATPEAYRPLLEKYHLLGIGANNSGNQHDVAMRIAHALYAVQLLRQRYDIAPERIYLFGLSGGGRVATRILLFYPEIFTGGMPVVGTNFYLPLKLADGRTSPGFWENPDPRRLNLARRNVRIAFLEGEKDPNREQTWLAYEAYRNDGFQFVTFLEQEKLGHDLPAPDWFARGLKFLDEPLRDKARKSFVHAQQLYQRHQLGAALQAYHLAYAHGPDEDYNPQARARLLELTRQYRRDAAAFHAQMQANPAPARAAEISARFQAQWGPHADADIQAATGKTPATHPVQEPNNGG